MFGHQLAEPQRPVGQRLRVRADDHHGVADRLDDARVVGQGCDHVADEAVNDIERVQIDPHAR